jgi:hypothetical protein
LPIAGDIFHHELLAKLFRQLLPDQPRHYVGRTAGCERHDDAHKLVRIGLGECRACR